MDINLNHFTALQQMSRNEIFTQGGLFAKILEKHEIYKKEHRLFKVFWRICLRKIEEHYEKANKESK